MVFTSRGFRAVLKHARKYRAFGGFTSLRLNFWQKKAFWLGRPWCVTRPTEPEGYLLRLQKPHIPFFPTFISGLRSLMSRPEINFRFSVSIGMGRFKQAFRGLYLFVFDKFDTDRRSVSKKSGHVLDEHWFLYFLYRTPQCMGNFSSA